MLRTAVLTASFAGFASLATPAAAIDPCLVGVWEADGSDMAHVMGTLMGNPVQHVAGTTSMEIDAFGNMTTLSDDMTYVVTSPDMPPFRVSVSGFGEGTMNADDGRNFVAAMPVYDMVGRAEIFGEILEIPINPTTPGAIPGQASGLYGCTADGLALDPVAPGTIPRRWTRVR